MNNVIPLTIEPYAYGEMQPFEVRSSREIYFILLDLKKQTTRVALYYEDSEAFIITSVIEVNDRGVWLDASSNHTDNMRLVDSSAFVFVSSHYQAKIQFDLQDMNLTTIGGLEAFHFPFPETILRIQRRDSFRLMLPLGTLKCVVTIEESPPRRRELLVKDISQGGVAIFCEERDPDIQPGRVFSHCHILLPEGKDMYFEMEVRYISMRTGESLAEKPAAGCMFTDIEVGAGIALQRFITQQQKNAAF